MNTDVFQSTRFFFFFALNSIFGIRKRVFWRHTSRKSNTAERVNALHISCKLLFQNQQYQQNQRCQDAFRRGSDQLGGRPLLGGLPEEAERLCGGHAGETRGGESIRVSESHSDPVRFRFRQRVLFSDLNLCSHQVTVFFSFRSLKGNSPVTSANQRAAWTLPVEPLHSLWFLLANRVSYFARDNGKSHVACDFLLICWLLHFKLVRNNYVENWDSGVGLLLARKSKYSCPQDDLDTDTDWEPAQTCIFLPFAIHYSVKSIFPVFTLHDHKRQSPTPGTCACIQAGWCNIWRCNIWRNSFCTANYKSKSCAAADQWLWGATRGLKVAKGVLLSTLVLVAASSATWWRHWPRHTALLQSGCGVIELCVDTT